MIGQPRFDCRLFLADRIHITELARHNTRAVETDGNARQLLFVIKYFATMRLRTS